jgi:predicted MFS family arabinose efflux permease
VLGTLFATAALWLLGASGAAGPENVAKMRVVFLWAGLPGLAAMVCLVLTPEPVRPSIANQAGLGDRRLSPTLKRVLVALTLFALANATDAFLIVKATKLGAAPALAPMLWLVLHTVKAATATRGGRLADRYGRRNALVCGWLVYAALWASIGAVTSLPALFALTALYGTSHGLVEGAERAFIAELSSGRNRGAAFGVYNLLIGMASLSASGLFGLAWDRFGSGVAFAGSGAFAVLAATSLLVLVPSHGVTQSP